MDIWREVYTEFILVQWVRPMRNRALIYFRAALLVPISLPLIAAGVARVLGPLRLEGLPGAIGAFLMLPVLSGAVAGGIYLLFAAFMAWHIRLLTPRQMVIQAILSPLYFGALAFASTVIWGLVIGDPSESAKIGALVAAYALALGYVYVVVILGVYFLIPL